MAATHPKDNEPAAAPGPPPGRRSVAELRRQVGRNTPSAFRRRLDAMVYLADSGEVLAGRRRQRPPERPASWRITRRRAPSARRASLAELLDDGVLTVRYRQFPCRLECQAA